MADLPSNHDPLAHVSLAATLPSSSPTSPSHSPATTSPPPCSAVVPWGFRSPAASRFAAAAAAVRDGSTVDFGRYMSEKKRKLQEQFQADMSYNLTTHVKAPVETNHLSIALGGGCSMDTIKDETKIFNGVSIFVNGFTIPSHAELHGLMMKHGGKFENYFSKSHVTHIICSNLPDSKIRNSRSFSKGLPIVKPEWILDSIAQGKLLHWSTYQPKRIAYDHPHQQKLSSFFGSRRESEKMECLPELAMQSFGKIGSDFPDTVTSVMDDPEKSLGRSNVILQSSCLDYGKQIPEKVEIQEECSQEEDVERTFASAASQDTNSDSSTCELYSKQESVAEDESLLSEDESSLGKRHHLGHMASSTGHSSLHDKNFVQNFFKHSRLHFIGTWRSRYHGCASEKSRPPDGSPSNQSPVIIHIDMDCFFVAVVVRSHPEMAGKPVAVCHSDSSHGTAEISSANYPARAYGVRAGMFIRDAKACCPSLEIVPYDFEGCEQVAGKLYDILHTHSKYVQALSCDEAYLDVTGECDPEFKACSIRNEIFDATKCTASAGIARNILLARLATRRAKPNGQYFVKPEEEGQFIADLPVSELPGVGWALKEKLHRKDIYTCHHLCTISKEVLQKEYGHKTGDMLWCYARGIDNRKVEPAQERKSIGAEVNWGVRFCHSKDVKHFLVSLCEEVSTRMQNACVRGRTFTLKVKRRKRGAGKPAKFMGCGICDNLCRSVSLAYATNKGCILLRIAEKLYSSLQLEPKDVRGVGLQVTKLDMSTSSQSDLEQKGLESWLALPGKSLTLNQCSIGPLVATSDTSSENRVLPIQSICNPHVNSASSLTANLVEMGNKVQSMRKGKMVQADIPLLQSNFEQDFKITNELHLHSPPELPPMSQLDHSVLESLPPDILEEIDHAYSGLLANKRHPASKAYTDNNVLFKIRNGFDKSASSSNPPVDQQNGNNTFFHETKHHKGVTSSSRPISAVHAHLGCQEKRIENTETEAYVFKENSMTHPIISCYGKFPDLDEVLGPDDLMPMSYSQIDKTVFEELPTQLKQDLIHALPAHSDRKNLHQPPMHDNLQGTDVLFSEVNSVVGGNELNFSRKPEELNELWDGNPPKWVRLFQETCGPGSKHLRFISCQYLCKGAHSPFVSFLLSLIPDLADSTFDGSKAFLEVVFCVSELVKQYIRTLVGANLEEVWTILRLVKRISTGVKFWGEVQNLLLPPVQDYVSESYGGKLNIK